MRPGEELKAYAEDCVRKYGVRDRIRLDTKVVGAELRRATPTSGASQTAGGEHAHRTFRDRGDRRLQPAEAARHPRRRDFRRGHDALRPLGSLGRAARQARRRRRHWRIGDPGDPGDRAEVEHLTVFQRTPIWCLPKLDAPLSARLPGECCAGSPGRKLAGALAQPGVRRDDLRARGAVRRHFPRPAVEGEGAGRKHLREVEDPDVREKLTPRYSLGCKRPSFSQRVRPHLQPRQRAARDRRHRGDHADRRPDRRRGRAPDRRAGPARPASRSSTPATCRRS